ncbi:MAG: cell division protein ZapA [Clostridiaceae bacterium]|nr:cell division protein ZapA [Eubacteriales bacterium]
MDKTRTVVRVAGQELKLSASESEEYMQMLAKYADRKFEEVQSAYPNLSTVNCLVLASLNMADELHRLRAEYDALDSRIAQLRELPRQSVAPVKRPFEAKQPTTVK